jgi:hypothetical protein
MLKVNKRRQQGPVLLVEVPFENNERANKINIFNKMWILILIGLFSNKLQFRISCWDSFLTPGVKNETFKSYLELFSEEYFCAFRKIFGEFYAQASQPPIMKI